VSQSFRYALLWLAGSTLLVIAALTELSAAHIDGQFLPSNPDAFYHARRILDSLFSGVPVIQFDPRIHAPEGSWLTWPWGFDTLMTEITRLFGPYANEADANRVLMNIPPAAAPIAVALVVTIARQLSLPFLLAILLVMGFSALPLVYVQFAVGNVDHHFAELLWTLGSLSGGIAFFRQRSAALRPGIVLGLTLGSALAIHNSLFVLQIPVAATLALLWMRGLPLPGRKQTFAFAASLLIVTLLVCIPSEPWRRGFFEFYTLSWFHLYLAGCVAVFSSLLAMLKFSARNFAVVVCAAAIALLPVVGTFTLAAEFVSGQLEAIRSVVEAKSPYVLHHELGEAMSTGFISWLMWLTFPMLLLNLWWIYRLRDTALQFVAIVGAMGLGLMQLQFRFSVFGELSMLLTPLLAAHFLSERRPSWRPYLTSGCAGLLAISFYPTIANWQLQWTLGGSVAYANLRSVFPVLKQLCDERPGIVLGDLSIGHWVTYHTKCSVIADVFLLTPQHARKAMDSGRLMHLLPVDLLKSKYQVRYVLPHHDVRLVLDDKGEESPRLEEVRRWMGALERELLAPNPVVPPEYKKRWEVRTTGGQIFARLYEIERPQ
jgi:hypothetical protein